MMRWGTVTEEVSASVADRMRDSDRRECAAAHGWSPSEAIERSVTESVVCRAILGEDGSPLGVCGVTRSGIIWLLATDDLLASPARRRQFVRGAIRWVRALAETGQWARLENWVLWRGGGARWLEALGFTVGIPCPMGQSCDLFAHAWRDC